jgi:myosin-5
MFLHRYRMVGAKELRQAARSARRLKPVDVLVSAVAGKIAANDTDITMKSPSGEVDLVSVSVQVGRTKVFLRRNAYEIMERLRNREIRNAVIKIQSIGRRYVAQQQYKNTHKSVVLIQSHVRRLIGRRIVV